MANSDNDNDGVRKVITIAEIHDSSNGNSAGSSQMRRQAPKSASERHKQYRERRKLNQPEPSTSASQRHKEYRERRKLNQPEPSTSSSQRHKKYRERRKFNQAGPSTSASDRHKQYRERRKLNQVEPSTSASQRHKVYRERRKLNQPEPSTSSSRRHKEYRKRRKFNQAGPSTSASDRHKQYRERRKLDQVEPTTSASDRHKQYRERRKLNQVEPSTSASQRHKEYRERQKLNQAKPSTSSSQRHKEYRERRKLNLLHTVVRHNFSEEAPRVTRYNTDVKENLIDASETFPNNTKDTLVSHTVVSEVPRKQMKICDVYSTMPETLIKVDHMPSSNTTNSEINQFIQHDQIDYQDVSSQFEIYDGATGIQQEIFSSEIPSSVMVNNVRVDVCENESLQSRSREVPNQFTHQIPIYTRYNQHASAHLLFSKIFKRNTFGHSCAVCDRLWWKNDLKSSSQSHDNILRTILQNFDSPVDICSTCKISLDKGKIPTLSTYNGFSYPQIPPHLPALDLISQRLISPRLPFMQIRRLRHIHGQYGIYGQIINVPVDVNTMVTTLPRNIDDDHCFYIHIKKKLIHKTSYVQGLVNKRKIKAWLTYLVQTPLYVHHNITIDNTFFEDPEFSTDINIDDVSEHIPIDDSLTAQQQTLLWDENDIFIMAPGQNNVPICLLFDEYAEELSFPAIYCGQFREYKENFRVTPFMQATSELRRTDRRGADPQHLLYIAIKIMRLRVRDCVTVAFKNVGNNSLITKENIQDPNYLNGCIESNLAFLRCIPNSAWYWSDRKKDLFAMMRQKGAPTAFMTLSCNEIGCSELLKLLYKFKNNGSDISDESLSSMSYILKSTLINEDAVTCAIYFNKLVNCLMQVLQAKKKSPFGKYRVLDYFLRIEFQHRGSPHAHVLLWLDNAPKDMLSNDRELINMVNELVSVSESESSGQIKVQTHKHTFTCYNKMDPSKKQKCRFGAPFMPLKTTLNLLPMKDTEDGYSEENFRKLKKHYKVLRENLENFNYADFNHFYAHNNIDSDLHYQNILRAGINRPKLFYQRLPSEKWHNPFNPFVLHYLKSNMDFQIIQDEYACAAYVVEYVNKSDRGFSNLQRQIIEIMDENPDFDIVQITRKISVDLISSVEMSAQEAAWYLLRMPMAKSSVATAYIPTIWPIERQRVRKTIKELEALEEDSTEIWKENWFDKYEKRPEELNNVYLAQFVSKYYKNNRGIYVERKEPRIIRYRNYDIADNFNDYRREMVLLYIPFRNEENDILAENKFIDLYDDNEETIMHRRKQFESNLDIAKTLQIIRELGRDDEEVSDEFLDENGPGIVFESNPYADLLLEDSHVNADLLNAALGKLGAVAKKRENIMENEQFYEMMRMANREQKDLLMHIIFHLQFPDSSPLQIFFTGPAGCGKTFVIKLIMEIYNRFTDTDGYCNAYINCASTGKAAVAIDGVTIHTALKITLSRFLPLSNENLQLYRSLFKYVRVLIIDEVSMVSAELLAKIHSRLKQITCNNINFGGIDTILIGDLRQLPPVRATPIFKQIRTRMTGPTLWRSLKFYELTQVMRQSDVLFSSTLTKIGNGEVLIPEELQLIESRFFKKEDAAYLCPDGVRLFLTNEAVNAYNNLILQQIEDKHISIADDVISGLAVGQRESAFRQKLHKLSVLDTGGLPYELTLVIGKFYIVTTNIDVADGLANGAFGKLVHIEFNEEDNKIGRLWMEFPGSKRIGEKKRRKYARLRIRFELSHLAVPIELRSSTIPLSTNKKVTAKRRHFPLIPACAMTIHKSQGGTFTHVVYEYDKKHSQQLVYVALSRITNINNLYIVTKDNNPTKFRFHHGRRQATSTLPLLQEFQRISTNTLLTKGKLILDVVGNRKGCSVLTLNCQSLRKHAIDLTDSVTQNCNILLLCETWMDNDQQVDIPNFNCIAKFKRGENRAAGVAIYHKIDDTANVLRPNMTISPSHTQDICASTNTIGDACSVICKMENGLEVVIVVVYISPNNKIDDIVRFIMQVLVEYNETVPQMLGHNHDKCPLILAGDFNLNFATEDSQLLKENLYNLFKLNMNNNPAEPTTKYGTTIDAVFSRYLDKIECYTYVSYFSYHKPIVSFIEHAVKKN